MEAVFLTKEPPGCYLTWFKSGTEYLKFRLSRKSRLYGHASIRSGVLDRKWIWFPVLVVSVAHSMILVESLNIPGHFFFCKMRIMHAWTTPFPPDCGGSAKKVH